MRHSTTGDIDVGRTRVRTVGLECCRRAAPYVRVDEDGDVKVRTDGKLKTLRSKLLLGISFGIILVATAPTRDQSVLPFAGISRLPGPALPPSAAQPSSSGGGFEENTNRSLLYTKQVVRTDASYVNEVSVVVASLYSEDRYRIFVQQMHFLITRTISPCHSLFLPATRKRATKSSSNPATSPLVPPP